MIEHRPFSTLGGENHGWLDAKHHFSFAGYHDPKRLHWGALRVWNDDSIAPHTGFDSHPHANMEIITYVRTGALTHRDSLGNIGRTEAGDVQIMSAGSGIWHSEYNEEPVVTQIFQIWILPQIKGGTPRWSTKSFPKKDRAGQLILLASGMESAENSLPLRANAHILVATLQAGQNVSHALGIGRKAYLVPAQGKVTVNGHPLDVRDGAAIKDESSLTITAQETAEIIIVDVSG